MSKSIVSKLLFPLIVSVCLACFSGPAFAQRGGGGGFHGGGGFRGGGGSGFRGGGAAGFRGGGFNGGFRGMSAPRGGGAFVRPGAPSGFRPSVSPAFRGTRPGVSSGTSRAMAPSRSPRSLNSDGRWSAFARRGGGPGSAAPLSQIRPGADRGAWQSFRSNRAPAFGSGLTRGSAAPNALEVRNSISQVRALSMIHRAFGNSDFGNPRFGLNAPVSATSRFGSLLPARPGGMAPGPGTLLRNSFSATTAANRFGFGDFNRFGTFDRFRFHSPLFVSPFLDFNNFFFFRNPFLFNNSFFFNFGNPFLFNNSFFFNDFFFRRPFFPCFACGFGFAGFNFGFGTPLWWGSGWPGWFGGIGYPYGLPYGYSLPYDSGLTYSSAAAGDQESDNSSATRAFRRTRKNAENSSASLLLYLTDGTMYSYRDCWLADGKLHCTATDRSESVFELEAIDFQRTVDENAKRGVPLTLKPNPTIPAPSR